MRLINTIKEDQLRARKEKAPICASLLTTLLGEINKIGKDDGNRETTDEEAIAVIKKFLKGVNETITHVADTNKDALSKCQVEKQLLEMYLPRQMTKEQIKGALLSTFGINIPIKVN